MVVDSYAFLPRVFRSGYDAIGVADHDPVWTPFEKSLDASRIGLLSSAGIFVRGDQLPFDVERERSEPAWGDPTLRVIPNDVKQSDVDATHLHINTADLLTDMNVALPIDRLNELATEGVVEAAPEHYSVMGYQQAGAEVWRTATAPEIVARCHAAEIDALILAPA